jgi:hypothetical protein
MPVLEHHGRLYRAFEDCTPCEWGRGFRAGIISAPADAELLDAASWTMSNTLPFDHAWVPADWLNPGWLEGNVVAAPDGALVNILRVNSEPQVNRAAITTVHDAGKRLSFDPAQGFIDVPGGMTKFTIRRDPASGHYLTLCNPTLAPGVVYQRNVLALSVSADLRQWHCGTVLLVDDSALSPEESLHRTGFQYADWQFDGDDLLYLVRTAYDGAHNFHDANRITFHRLARFREHLPR